MSFGFSVPTGEGKRDLSGLIVRGKGGGGGGESDTRVLEAERRGGRERVSRRRIVSEGQKGEDGRGKRK